jgi:hypothetical protein
MNGPKQHTRPSNSMQTHIGHSTRTRFSAYPVPLSITTAGWPDGPKAVTDIPLCLCSCRSSATLPTIAGPAPTLTRIAHAHRTWRKHSVA